MATEKAKLIASAVRGGTVFVYAASSKDPVLAAQNAHKTLNKMETSSFECSDCGSKQHVVASVSPEPYCVTCGSDQVIESNRRIPETAAFVSDDELASVTCGACATENVLPVKAVRASKGCLHCVTCGGGLAVAEADAGVEGDEKEEADFAPNPNVTPSAGGGATDIGDEDNFPDVETSEADDSEDDDSESFTEESDAVDGLDEIELENNGGQIAMDAPMFSEDQEAFNEVPNFGDMGVEEPGNEEQLFLDDVTNTAGEGMAGESMMDAMELNDTPDGLEFVSKAGVLIARKGAHAVAFARTSDVGTNADILHTPEFAKAVTITAGRVGTRKALARMGFKEITVKPVDVKAAAREVAKARGKFETIQAAKQKVFADSLAIASVGMAKGLFKGFQDPIRAAVEATLTASMGARTAKVTASRIMSTNGIEYAKGLLALANKLSGMTEVARKEYAEMLDLVDDGASNEVGNADEMPSKDYEQAADLDGNGVEDVTDVSEDLDSVQSRLTTAAVLLRPKNVTANTRKTSPSNSAAAILAGTAPLRFGGF